MLYIYHDAHMYIRRFSIYTINAYPYIYTYEIILHTYQRIYVWDNDHAPTQIYPSYTHIFVVQLSSSHFIVTMSHIMTMIPKLPLRKCPLHSKFPGSLQSSHSASWNYRPTQYFGHHKITWSNQGWGFLSWGTIVHPFNEINFRHAHCNSLSNPGFEWYTISGYGPL